MTKDGQLETAVRAYALAARFHGIQLDPVQIQHELKAAVDHHSDDAEQGAIALLKGMSRIGPALGLTTRIARIAADDLERAPLPAVSIKGDDFLLISSVQRGQISYYSVAPIKRMTIAVEEFSVEWAGYVVFVGPAENEAPVRIGWQWFAPILQKYRARFAEIFVAGALVQALSLAPPIVFQVVIDKVLVHQSTTTLHVLMVGLCCFAFVEISLDMAKVYVHGHTTKRVDVEAGARLFAHLMRLPLRYFDRRRVGDTVSRIRELDNLRYFYSHVLLNGVIDLLFTVVFLVVMWIYSSHLTLLVFVAMLFHALLILLSARPLRQRINRHVTEGANSHALLVEAVSGIETTKACAIEQAQQRSWEEQFAIYLSRSFDVTKISNFVHGNTNLIARLTTIGILWVGSLAVMGGRLSVGELVAFNMIAARLTSPYLRLLQLVHEFQKAAVSVERLQDMYSVDTEAYFGDQRRVLSRVCGAMEMQQVSFAYAVGQHAEINNVSLDIKAGESLGLVGPSGSGKSTLAKLLQGTYRQDSGQITLDGVDIHSLNPQWLRRQVHVITQEPFLFHHTIHENIALRAPRVSVAQVISAARFAGIHDFIMSLPEGYETRIEEHASNLSRGQCQRIAIARAILLQPKILILDEGTNALDAASESALIERLIGLTPRCTLICITHRLANVEHMNKIVVVERGRTIEAGTHKALVDTAGYYATAWRHQSSARYT